jgi:NADH dehydrogenase/NADH:ubiquinone oxidoreductase subunit G
MLDKYENFLILGFHEKLNLLLDNLTKCKEKGFLYHIITMKTETSLPAYILNLKPINKIKTKLDVLYILGTTNLHNISSNFVIYQASHFNSTADKANLLLPTVSTLEDKFLTFNLFGKVIEINPTLFLNNKGKTHFNIFNFFKKHLNIQFNERFFVKWSKLENICSQFYFEKKKNKFLLFDRSNKEIYSFFFSNPILKASPTLGLAAKRFTENNIARNNF